MYDDGRNWRKGPYQTRLSFIRGSPGPLLVADPPQSYANFLISTDPEYLGKLGDQLSREVANICIENKELLEAELKEFVPNENSLIAQHETLKKQLKDYLT